MTKKMGYTEHTSITLMVPQRMVPSVPRSLIHISARRQFVGKDFCCRLILTPFDRHQFRRPNLGPSPTVRKMSSAPTVAPYGTWISPITAAQISGSNNRFAEVHVDVSRYT